MPGLLSGPQADRSGRCRRRAWSWAVARAAFLHAMMAPAWKISPPQTPHGSARSSAPARQAVRSGHCWQCALACSSSAGNSENHRSLGPRWHGSGSASAAGSSRADAALEALGMTMLRAPEALASLCVAGLRGGSGRERPASSSARTMSRSRGSAGCGPGGRWRDDGLLIRIFVHAETPLRGGCRRPERPLCTSDADVRLRLVILVSACGPRRPGGHLPHSRSRDPGNERAGRREHRHMSIHRNQAPEKDRTPLAGQPLRRPPIW